MSKRLVSLIAALLAVIMLIPSVALAANEKLTVTGSYTGDFTGEDWGEHNALATESTVKAEGLAEGFSGYIQWTIDDGGVASFHRDDDQHGWGYYPDTQTNIDVEVIPTVYAEGPGTAKITGQIYEYLDNEGDSMPVGTAGTYKVTLKPVVAEKINLAKKTLKIRANSGINLYNYIESVEPDNVSYWSETDWDEQGNPIEWKPTMVWSMDAKYNEYATLDNNGRLNAKKATADGVKVTATAKDTKVKAEFTVIIIAEDAEPGAEDPEYYTAVTPREDTYTIKKDGDGYWPGQNPDRPNEIGFDLGRYMTLTPDWTDEDALVWTSSNSQVATLAFWEGDPEDPQDDGDWGHTYPYVVVHQASKDPVTFTAWSVGSGKKLGSVKVIASEEAAEEVLPTEIIVAPGELFLAREDYDLDNYVVDLSELEMISFKPVDATETDLFWAITKGDDYAKINQDGELTLKAAGDVEVTISSLDNKACKPAVVTIHIKEKAWVPYKKVEQLKETITIYEGDSDDLSRYLKVIEPKDADDSFVWYSEDASYVYVDVGDGEITAIKEGTTKIHALSYLDRENKDLEKVFTVTVKSEKDKVIDTIKFIKDSFTVKKSTEFFNPWPFIVVDPIMEKNIDYPQTYLNIIDYIIELLSTGEESVEDLADLISYLDELQWVSSDTSVATVDKYGFVTFEDIRDKSATVTITVRSKKNPKNAKSFTLTIENDDQFYETLTFVAPKSYKTSYEAGCFVASDYLDTEPAASMVADYEDLIWTSSDLNVAYVVATTDPKTKVHTAKVFFKNPGKVTITVRSKYNEKATDKFDLEITDVEKPITAITLTQSDFTLTKEDNGILFTDFLEDYLIVTPVDYEDYLVFTSDNPDVIKVVNNVIILGKPGTAKVTVHSQIKGISASFNMTVTKEELTSVKFIKEVPTELSKNTGFIDLTKYIVTEPWYYAYDYPTDLVWSSDNPQYAHVTDHGVVCYENPGATVTISVGDKAGKLTPATIKLTTTDVWVTEIKFAATAMDMAVGDEFYLKKADLSVTPADADYDEITWTTSDPDIVDIEVDKDVMAELEALRARLIEQLKQQQVTESAKPVLTVGYIPEVTPVLKIKAKGVGTATITASINNAYNQVSGSFTVTVAENAVTSIKFAKKSYTKKIGTFNDNTVRLYFKANPYKASVDTKYPDNTFNVESSNRNVVEPVFYTDGSPYMGYDSVKGLFWVDVECVAPGTAKIIVTCKDNEKVVGKTKVVVEPIAVKKIKLPKKSMKLFYYNQGETHEILQNYYKISPKIQPSNAWYNVTWETTNAGVAFVKDNLENGEKGVWIVATGAGTATITMTVDDGTNIRQAKMKITVVAKTVDLKLNKSKAKITMIKGKDNTLQLEAYDPVTEEPVPVKWKSSNKKIASVDKTGLVTAKKAGEVTITATTKDGNETTAVCNLTVEKKQVTSLKAKASVSLKRKETKQLKIKVKPTDAYDTALSFKSSDEKIVTVDENGLLKGIAAGEAIVTVATKDGSKLSLEIAVTVTK